MLNFGRKVMQKRLEGVLKNALFYQRWWVKRSICPKKTDLQMDLLLVNHPFGVVVYLITQDRTTSVCGHFRRMQMDQMDLMKNPAFRTTRPVDRISAAWKFDEIARHANISKQLHLLDRMESL